MVRNSVRFALVGVAAGVVAPLGLVVCGFLVGRSPDPLHLFLFMVGGGALALGGAGWLMGRKDDELARRNRALVDLSEQLRALSTTDALTGLPNRRAFDERLQAEIARANRHGAPLALVMIDLDHFKALNDRFGHQVGDAVLSTVGAVLGSERRLGDLAARYGGEEFVAILPHADEDAAQAWAERVRARIAGTAVDVDGQLARVTASFGVAAARPEDEDKASLVAAADQALYQAKARGRDRVAVAGQRGTVRPGQQVKRAR